MISLNLSGLVPGKKNSRILDVKRGYVRNLPSRSYLDWYEDAGHQIKAQVRGNFDNYPLYVAALFYMPDKRRRDLSNMIQSIEDLLVSLEIIKDDAWEYWRIAGLDATLEPSATGAVLWISEDQNEVRKALDSHAR